MVEQRPYTGLPFAVAYDIQEVLRLLLKSILSPTGSIVIDLIDTFDFFERQMLNCFAGPDTPCYWSRAGRSLEDQFRLFAADQCSK